MGFSGRATRGLLFGQAGRYSLRGLLEKHADSRYLRRARLELLEVKAYEIWNDADRRTNKPARYL